MLGVAVRVISPAQSVEGIDDGLMVGALIDAEHLPVGLVRKCLPALSDFAVEGLPALDVGAGLAAMAVSKRCDGPAKHRSWDRIVERGIDVARGVSVAPQPENAGRVREVAELLEKRRLGAVLERRADDGDRKVVLP